LSRLREVLKKADAPGWEETTPKRMGPWRPVAAARTMISPEAVRNAFATPGTGVEVQEPVFAAVGAAALAHPCAVSEGEPQAAWPTEALLPESRPTLSSFARFTRKVRRWFGLPVGRAPARCSGITRNGLPCRAPAMDNGQCRMHGGVRQRSLVEMMR